MKKTLLCIFLCISVPLFAVHLPLVSNGTLDLRQWDDVQHPVIDLNGKWAFYWNNLYSAKDIKAIPVEYAEISLPWNEQTINGKTYPKNGYATYVLKVMLRPGVKTFSLRIPAVFNSSSLWINDSLVVSSGNVTPDEQTMVPLWRPNAVGIHTIDSTLYICLRIANFQGTRGGCAEIPKLGRDSLLVDSYKGDITTGKALIAVYSIISLIALVAFYGTGVRSYLALCFVAAAFVIRFLFSDLYMIYHIGWEWPWSVIIRLEYCSIPIIILSAANFFHLIYPREFGRKSFAFFGIISVIAIFGVVSVPGYMLTETLKGLQLLGLIFSFAIVAAILKAIYRNRHGAWLSALSFLCFAGVGFYNIYAFLFAVDLNRLVIFTGYTIALLLSGISLNRRTPIRLKEEEHETLRYEDLYGKRKD